MPEILTGGDVWADEDDSIHLPHPTDASLTLCGQLAEARRLNVARDGSRPDSWSGCWSCLDLVARVDAATTKEEPCAGKPEGSHDRSTTGDAASGSATSDGAASATTPPTDQTNTRTTSRVDAGAAEETT